ncbi:MAG: hypothetical protein L0Y76_10475, partial [Ignavibacteria bacterium]|nr:hypothetical protein [Ignavibacteria bacterium]
MQSKILLSVLIFIVILIAVLFFGGMLVSCADDMTPSNGIINFEFTSYDDSITVLDFEVLGTKASEKRQIYVNFTDNNFSAQIDIDYYENGSLTLNVYQNQVKISSLKVAKETDTTVVNLSGSPTKIEVIPADFT